MDKGFAGAEPAAAKGRTKDTMARCRIILRSHAGKSSGQAGMCIQSLG